MNALTEELIDFEKEEHREKFEKVLVKPGKSFEEKVALTMRNTVIGGFGTGHSIVNYSECLLEWLSTMAMVIKREAIWRAP